jgi:phosphoribosylformimino-5-aminoimidazole carboxamide ribotide isomerase
MRVIGVVDLLDGRAVHARAGLRAHYQPVRAIAGVAIEPGDPLALGRGYHETLGLTEFYAADLDAILGRVSQDAPVSAMVALGLPVWLDAGVTSVGCARHALGLGAAHVIIGLETLSSYDDLGTICRTLGSDRVAFSLDLRNGEPIEPATIPPGGKGDAVELVTRRAVDAGVGAVIVIDLARVGTGMGPDLQAIARVRRAAPGVTLLAGGGVRGLDDLVRLADAGCDAALVATALHDGRIGATEVAAARRLHARRRTGRAFRGSVERR